jgi:hypothetical protein
MTAGPNVYYCHSINRGPGILRAVLSRKEARSLLKHVYVGQQFPTAVQGQTDGDVAIIRILDEEGLGEEWQDGFYSFDANIMRVEEAIQASTAKLSRVSGAVDYLTGSNDHNRL